MGSPGKHILIIVQNLPVPFDRRVWQEATTLKQSGFEVSVICPKKKIYTKGFEVLEGVEIHRYPLVYEADSSVIGYFVEFIYCWFASFLLAAKAYIYKPFQVIHACNPPDTFFALALLFRPFGVKFVFDHHDLSPEMFVAKGRPKKGLLYKGLILLERWTFKTADLVIAVNESHKEIAIQRGKIPENKTVIVRSGPRSRWGQSAHADPTLKRGKKYLAMYLGEMCAQDGVDHLLYAVADFKKRYADDTQFVFVGGGPDQLRLKLLASEMGLDDMVYFTGRIPDEDLWKYLATADICVDPDPLTQWSNLSTMNKIMEYMAFGRPIVAFDLLENRRSAMDAAIYVTPNKTDEMASTIRQLIESEEKREVMSKYGRQRFESNLCWDYSALMLIKAYDALLLGS